MNIPIERTPGTARPETFTVHQIGKIPTDTPRYAFEYHTDAVHLTGAADSPEALRRALIMMLSALEQGK